MKDTEKTKAQLLAELAELRAENSRLRQAEEALQASDRRFSIFMEHCPNLVFIKDAQGTYLFANAAYGNFLGVRPEDIIGVTDGDLFPPDVAEFLRTNDEKVRLARKELTFEESGELKGEMRHFLSCKFPLPEPGGEELAVAGFGMEITELRRTQEELLRERNQFIRDIEDSLPEGAVYRLIHAPDGRQYFEHVSAGFERIFPLTTEMMTQDATALYAMVHPDDIDQAQQVERHSAENLKPFRLECRFVLPDGETRWVQWHSMPQRLADGGFGWNGIVVDVTERRQADEMIAASLKEKEVLVREIHHRVKNNMQVVISLLRLQSGAISDPQIRAVFSESESRIKAMALVHETLHRSNGVATVSCREYLARLVDGIARSHRAGPTTLSCEISDLSIHIDQAVPLGLIVNELVCNAIEHAFPDDRQGQVKVTMSTAGEHACKLEVSDDGVGMPEEFDLDSNDSLGLLLITTLAQDQLGGTLEISSDNGTRFVVIFKRKET